MLTYRRISVNGSVMEYEYVAENDPSRVGHIVIDLEARMAEMTDHQGDRGYSIYANKLIGKLARMHRDGEDLPESGSITWL